MQELGNQFNIGFVGVPPLNLIKELYNKHKNIIWVDLDEPSICHNGSISNTPKTTCRIIQTIYSNFVNYDLNLLIATTGSSKCDSMDYLLPSLKDIKPNVEIISVNNTDMKVFPQPISISSAPLLNKFQYICESITKYEKKFNLSPCKPKAGFWGVPPYDYSILELFPDETHVYGWARCMEAKTPSNLELELMVDKNIPTVFYTQLFCAKSILAKNLANKYNGLFVECDGLIDNSTKEKITAFLELNNCY